MHAHRGRALPRRVEPITSVILSGHAWTAGHIANNCLRQHCHQLATTFRWGRWGQVRRLSARLLHVLETRSRVLIEIHPTQLAVIAAVVRLAAYHRRWLRLPECWWPDPNADARTQWSDFLRHLLARYPVPSFLDGAWEIPGSIEHFERDCWCALAQGKGLRRVTGFPRSVPSRVIHTALTAEAVDGCTTIVRAIWQALFARMQLRPSLRAAFLASRAGREFGDYALWARLLAKFAANDAALDRDFGLVADVLVARRFHCGAAAIQPLLRLPLPDLIRHCTRLVSSPAHALETRLPRHGEQCGASTEWRSPREQGDTWRPMLGDQPFTFHSVRDQGSAAWRIEELCSVDALRSEGNVMSHCVDTYAQSCRNGYSAIFSVRQEEENAEGETDVISYATIEVYPRIRMIMQIRTYRNCRANNTIMSLIYEWARAKGLKLRGD